MKTVLFLLLTLVAFNSNASFDQFGTTIIKAAQTVNVDPLVLSAFAHKETNFRNVKATYKKSTAAGLFQINNRTWKGLLEKYGHEVHLDTTASKFDPRANSLMAGIYVRENAKALKRVLGRKATPAEMYMSHLLGLGGAIKVLTAKRSKVIADVVAYAIAGNKRLFVTEKGKFRTVGQFRDYMHWKFSQVMNDIKDTVDTTVAKIEAQKHYNEMKRKATTYVSSIGDVSLKLITVSIFGRTLT
jgi:DNA-binding cell septation regulator SpoVG